VRGVREISNAPRPLITVTSGGQDDRLRVGG
jgi:hypothetical protein